MIDLIIRTLKRLVILIPGILITYIVAKDFYPVINKKVPLAPAIFITYIITAYFLIPAFMRTLKVLLKPKYIPHYSTTSDGFASDPVNIGVVGTRKQLIGSMSEIDWKIAHKQNLRNLLRMGFAILLKKSYPNAPFSNLYLFGRKQDIGFQLPIGNSPLKRHHVRFWLVSPVAKTSKHAHLEFWERHIPVKRLNETHFWIGAASLDTGLGFITHNAQLTHSVHPDTDEERDFITKQLKKANLVEDIKIIKLIDAYKLRNRVFRSHLASDGKMKIITLKRR